LDIKKCFKNFDLTLHQKHNNTFHVNTDGILPEKLPLSRAKKLLGNYTISDEEIAMLIDELYKLSVITYKIYSE
jgi:hypothetical protein